MRLTLILCLVLTLAAPVRAEVPPTLPCSWSGETNLPVGSRIEPWSGLGHGRYRHTTTVFFFESTPVYRIDVKADDPTTTEREGAVEGELIAFRALSALYPYTPIGWANEVGTWRLGANNPNFYLTFTGGITSTPTATTPPTSQLRLVIEAPVWRDGGQRGSIRVCACYGQECVCATVELEVP